MYYETLAPAAIGDVGGDGVDPVERIEEANGRTGAGIGRCGDLKHAVVGPSDAIGCKRRARHVAREPLQLPGNAGRAVSTSGNQTPSLALNDGSDESWTRTVNGRCLGLTTAAKVPRAA